MKILLSISLLIPVFLATYGLRCYQSDSIAESNRTKVDCGPNETFCVEFTDIIDKTWFDCGVYKHDYVKTTLETLNQSCQVSGIFVYLSENETITLNCCVHDLCNDGNSTDSTLFKETESEGPENTSASATTGRIGTVFLTLTAATLFC